MSMIEGIWTNLHIPDIYIEYMFRYIPLENVSVDGIVTIVDEVDGKETVVLLDSLSFVDTFYTQNILIHVQYINVLM